MREYLAALRIAIAATESAEISVAAEEWLDWGERWVESRDHLAHSVAMPSVPDPNPDDLKPFLGKCSPYGAESPSWR